MVLLSQKLLVVIKKLSDNQGKKEAFLLNQFTTLGVKHIKRKNQRGQMYAN